MTKNAYQTMIRTISRWYFFCCFQHLAEIVSILIVTGNITWSVLMGLNTQAHHHSSPLSSRAVALPVVNMSNDVRSVV